MVYLESLMGLSKKSVVSVMCSHHQVDENTETQLMLLHSDIPGYYLPAIDFVSPSEEAQESHILEEQDTMIYTLRKGAHTHG